MVGVRTKIRGDNMSYTPSEKDGLKISIRTMDRILLELSKVVADCNRAKEEANTTEEREVTT